MVYNDFEIVLGVVVMVLVLVAGVVGVLVLGLWLVGGVVQNLCSI